MKRGIKKSVAGQNSKTRLMMNYIMVMNGYTKKKVVEMAQMEKVIYKNIQHQLIKR